MGNIIIRTVLDLRSQAPKYLLQTLLLAASWHRFGRETAPLEVLYIGPLPPPLRDRLASFGVVLKPVEPNQNDGFSKTSNTIQGAAPVDGKQILLVDNDVVVTGALTDLCQLDPQTVYGAVAGNTRVKQPQWDYLATLGHCPHPCSPEVPRTGLVRTRAAGEPPPPAFAFSYVNGGVLLLPAGTDFQSIWQRTQKEIADAFHGHRLNSDSVCKSNMAALAVTVGAYGVFDWLPRGYNFRHADFALGLSDAENIKLVHMTGLGKRTEATSLSGWILEYWGQKMTKSLGLLKDTLSASEYDHRIAATEIVLGRILDIVAEYDLDPLAQTLMTMRAPDLP